jgi:single-strand selective monofunctional uracil DNA glycosylase
VDLVDISRRLSRRVGRLEFGPPVAFVYNPLDYAREPHEQYLRRYGTGPKQIILLGMNPGPFGMAQTGVPFGEVSAVRDWMGVDGKVKRPRKEHDKRPVLGFDCPRSEVSGARLWGWARAHFDTPGRFFERFFVVNYCPLAFLEESGRNRTPDKLPAAEREPLHAACDEALSQVVELLQPEHLVGVGAFAEKRARLVLGDSGPRISSILHPSPANPRANKGWSEAIEAQFRESGIEL